MAAITSPLHALITNSPSIVTGLLVTQTRILVSLDSGAIEVFDYDARKRYTLAGHTGGVWAMKAASVDRLLTGSIDNTIRLWDLQTGDCLHIFLGHTNTVRDLGIVDDDTFVSGSRDTTLRVWDIQTRECKHVLRGHEATVRAVAVSGNYVVSVSYDNTGRVWDIEDGTLVHTLCGHLSNIYRVVFDKVKKRIVTGAMDCTLRVWDLDTGQRLATLEKHNSLVSILELGGDILISAGADGMICAWDFTKLELLHSVNAHPHAAVVSLAFVDSRQVISGGADGDVKMWTLDTDYGFQLERSIGETAEAVWQVAIHENRAIIAKYVDQTPVLEIHQL